MENLMYVGFITTLVGFLFYASTIWAMVLGKRKIMVGCFASGSLLMSTGLVLAVFLPEGVREPTVASWVFSAIVWLIFGAITLSMKGYCDDVLTSSEVKNKLDGGVNLSGEDVEGFWCAWDRSYWHKKGNDFFYSLVQVYKVDSMLNTIRGKEHYKIRTLERGFNSQDEVQAYLDKFNGTAIKL